MRTWNEKLFLGPLPRGDEELSEFLNDLEHYQISWIVRLLSTEEIMAESPQYARWWETQAAYDTRCLPIPDGSVPTTRHDIDLFWETAFETGEIIETDEQRVLVHCSAGIGRTGTYAVAVLLCLGMDLDDALTQIRTSGSAPETQAQHDFLAAGPPPLMLHNRTTYGFDWRADQKERTRDTIERLDAPAFAIQLGGPNKGCMLNHLNGKTGYLTLQDAMSNSYRVYDYDTDEQLGSYPDLDTLVGSGWKVST